MKAANLLVDRFWGLSLGEEMAEIIASGATQQVSWK